MTLQISHPDSNKIGRFNILTDSLDERVAALFTIMTVLKVEPHESGRGKTFFAASDLFQPLLEGEEIPEYRIDSAYDCAFPDADKESRRINVGKFGFVAIRQHIIRVPPASVHAIAC